MKSVSALVGFFSACFAAAAIGGIATNRSLRGWYPSLRKPSLNPPGWVFGPVWTTLYSMMAVAAWLDWRNGRSSGNGQRALGLFGLQLGLNTLWSLLFFGLRAPGLALLEIGTLWTSIAAWLLVSIRVDRRTLSG